MTAQIEATIPVAKNACLSRPPRDRGQCLAASPGLCHEDCVKELKTALRSIIKRERQMKHAERMHPHTQHYLTIQVRRDGAMDALVKFYKGKNKESWDQCLARLLKERAKMESAIEQAILDLCTEGCKASEIADNLERSLP